MKKLAYSKNVFVSLLFFLPTFILAQVIQTNAKNNSVDYEKLAKIDDVVNDYIAKNWLTCAVSLVIKDVEVGQYKGYGFADVASKKPMKNDAIFRIMSQTKAITSVGILILYEQGKFLLDESI